jgi:hypothetical protein
MPFLLNVLTWATLEYGIIQKSHLTDGSSFSPSGNVINGPIHTTFERKEWCIHKGQANPTVWRASQMVFEY